METGRIAAGEPFDLQASFAFETEPDGVGGELGISGTVLLGEDFGSIDIDGLNVSGDLRGIAEQPTEFNFDARTIGIDLNAERIEPGEMDMRIFDVGMTAKVEPFSYAGEPMPVAELQVREFSLKDLMRTLAIEPPVTASGTTAHSR